MFSALLSFLGGSVFRMIWGEVSAAWTKHQDHKHELAMMGLQAQLDAAKHARELESIKAQHAMGVEVIRVQGEARALELDLESFKTGVELTGRASGFTFVDAWNSAIRPALATGVGVLIALHYARIGWQLDENGWQLAGAILGLYTADRALFKRGK